MEILLTACDMVDWAEAGERELGGDKTHKSYVQVGDHHLEHPKDKHIVHLKFDALTYYNCHLWQMYHQVVSTSSHYRNYHPYFFPQNHK